MDAPEPTDQAPNIVPEQLGSYDHAQIAISLATSDLLRTSQKSYFAILSAELDKIPIKGWHKDFLDATISKQGGFSNENSPKQILLKPLSHEIMIMIWCDSTCMPEDVLQVNGYSRPFRSKNTPLTRNSLANRVCDGTEGIEARDVGRIKRTIDRICDALEIYGLIERSEVRSNLKPFQGTEQLHAIMIRTNQLVSHLFASQLLTEGGDENE